jgi:hypothetical protein
MNPQTLEPLSREYLQNIYQVTQEAIRKRKINDFISWCYNEVKMSAQLQNKKSFIYYLDINMNNSAQLFKDNKDEILSGIQLLFPDSKIHCSNIVVAKDNSIQHVQDIDEKLKPFLNMKNIREALIVDWS